MEQWTGSKVRKEYDKALHNCISFAKYQNESATGNFYIEYIIQNARLDESQTGIKITRRNINNLRYADDTTLMTESKEEQKDLWMKVKREMKKLT